MKPLEKNDRLGPGGTGPSRNASAHAGGGSGSTPTPTSASAPADAPSLYDLDRAGLEALLRRWGQPVYRARQVWRQLYVRLAESPEAMSDLPADLRRRLAAETRLGRLRPAAVRRGDGGLTQKALWTLADGSPVESVLMVYPDRATACVSCQSGCPMACVFCATGKLGFLQDLTAGEIVEQVMWAARTLRALGAAQGAEKLPAALTNVVFMGMGEPFNNYRAWWESVERLHDPAGFNLGARSFTVSTAGLVPGILRLAEERLPINLAVSLHAPDDALRTRLMPVNKRYPIADLLAAVRAYTEKTHRRVSFEYVLMQETNDAPEQAAELARRLRPPGERPLLCHVNLIPWNPVPGAPLARSQRRRVLAFQAELEARGVPCTVRVERGAEIAAACGQLAGELKSGA